LKGRKDAKKYLRCTLIIIQKTSGKCIKIVCDLENIFEALRGI
jgi:hypothetical protein